MNATENIPECTSTRVRYYCSKEKIYLRAFFFAGEVDLESLFQKTRMIYSQWFFFAVSTGCLQVQGSLRNHDTLDFASCYCFPRENRIRSLSEKVLRGVGIIKFRRLRSSAGYVGTIFVLMCLKFEKTFGLQRRRVFFESVATDFIFI